MSLIAEEGEKAVRMANLAIVGSHAVNGVAALHTDILKKSVFRDFHEWQPNLISNKTNGITPRRWLVQCNPRLASLIDELLGEEWKRDLDQLKALSAHGDVKALIERLSAIKKENKKELAVYLQSQYGLEVDPESLFDMQVKRLHEYKRQLLNVLGMVARYIRAKEDPTSVRVSRTHLFGAKAAPGYFMAKLIIKLINAVADVLQSDDTVLGLSICFVPNYGVSLAERLIPACELSEQISVAGMEASGTGNMKLALNGALTIGTLDGANIEIREAVGAENFFLFGMNAEEVEATWRQGYNPRNFYENDDLLRETIDLLASGFFSPEQPELFKPIVDHLLHTDTYRVMADFRAYLEAQDRVDETYLDTTRWNTMALHNIAQMGRFSSDRTIGEYAREIWRVTPVSIEVPPYVSTDVTGG
jgi:starch phosphorylase